MAACRRRRRSSGLVVRSGLFVLALWALPAAAQTVDWVRTQDVGGTLGSDRIGGALTIEDDRVFVAGHYFYASHLANIPLTGSLRGADLDLAEPGGGTFHLHLMGGRHAELPAHGFDTATGLAGLWTVGGKTLPVRLHFTTTYAGPFPARLYDSVTMEPDHVFEASVQHFVRDVLAGDESAASAFVSYPLRVNASPTFMVRSASELKRRWGQVFTPGVLEALRDGIPHEMFTRNGEAMIGRGKV